MELILIRRALLLPMLRRRFGARRGVRRYRPRGLRPLGLSPLGLGPLGRLRRASGSGPRRRALRLGLARRRRRGMVG
ncbi:MAG: hypothetical protein ACREE5_07480, partial [Acetobacteraceae bacterium]